MGSPSQNKVPSHPITHSLTHSGKQHLTFLYLGLIGVHLSDRLRIGVIVDPTDKVRIESPIDVSIEFKIPTQTPHQAVFILIPARRMATNITCANSGLLLFVKFRGMVSRGMLPE